MICIPMAGSSARFFSEGYLVPKYELELNNRPLFAHVLNSFRRYFHSETFVFITNKSYNAEIFVRNEVKKLGILNYRIVELNAPTHGQAETVALGLTNIEHLKGETLLIFNIDTIRTNFEFPPHFPHFPWIETFSEVGDHWSFVKNIPGTNRVERVTEKERISNLCCTGAYFFPTIQEFLELFAEYVTENNLQELYVAPIYNIYLERGREVRFNTIANSEIHLAGTPKEFQKLIDEGFSGEI